MYRSEKKDPYRTRITMGGNLINYPSDCGTPTADLLTVKLMFNSIILTPNAKFMTIDIEECTASLKPESLHKSSSQNDSTKQDTAKAQ